MCVKPLRLVVAVLGLSLALLWPGLVSAAPPAQPACADVTITSPRSGGLPVQGQIRVEGSARIPNQQFYKLEWAPEPVPSDFEWRVFAGKTGAESQVVHGLLGTWDTTSVPDGSYSLRLTVVDITGNYPCPPVIIRQIVVANTRLLPTPTLTLTPTPTETPAAFTPTPIPPRPTIILPTQPPPSPTPIATRAPVTTEIFGIDLASLGQALLWGAGGMGGLVLVLGLLFGARWLFDQIGGE